MPLFRKAKPKLTIPRLFKDGSNGAWLDPSDLWGGSQRLVRRNLLTYSEDFSNAAWSKTGTTTSGTTITATASNSFHLFGRTATTTGSTGAITILLDVKKGTHPYVLIDCNNGATNYAAVVVDLDTATITKTQYSGFSQLVAPSILDVGSGWFGISFSMLTTIDTAVSVQLASSSNPTITTYGLQSAWTALGTETIDIRNIQLARLTTNLTYQKVTDWTTEQYQYAATTQYPWLRRNRFLNTSTLSTQTVSSVTATPLTVSFNGAGTLTFSTAYVGSLAGTGANNRVSLTFTPSAGNLVCTVSGSVTEAQCEVGSTATTYQPIGASWDAQYSADESAAGHVPVLFQDRAGTNPCNADGQTVGKILDKSGRGNHSTAATDANRPLLKQDGNGNWYTQGDLVDDVLVAAFSVPLSTLGSELVTNGTFADSTGWDLDSGWSITGGALVKTSGSSNGVLALTGATITSGSSYLFNFDYTDSGPNVFVGFASTTASGALISGSVTVSEGSGNKRIVLTAPQNCSAVGFMGNATGSASIDSFSCKKINPESAEYISGASSSTETTGIVIDTTYNVHAQAANYGTVIRTAAESEPKRSKLLQILDKLAGR